MWQTAAKISGSTVAGAAMAVTHLARRNNRRAAIPKKIKYSYKEPETREAMMKRMQTEVFDVLVVGGGSAGCGVALDSATRGLKCALVEADDFASGTSSRSTKLIHGGIRYLQAAVFNLDINQFKLVCEALEERAHMMRAAPFMSKALPILMPVYKTIDVPMLWCGVKMYDWIGKLVTLFKPGLPNCFWISRSNAMHFFPLINPKKLKGAIVYYDGQMNDARMNLELALTSAQDGYIEGMVGACIANHCRVRTIRSESGNAHGNLTVVEVEDRLTGKTFNISARAVVNCTGPVGDNMRKKNDPNSRSLIAASSGVHVALPHQYSSPEFGMIIPETTDGRVLYYLPWEGGTIAGTTDQAAVANDRPIATQTEVDFICQESCRYLSVQDEELRKDIKSTWSGYRPLVTDPRVDSAQGGTKKLSRTHEVLVEKNGMISLMGGKWTTYRKMAEDCVNKVLSVHAAQFKGRNILKPRTKFMLMGSAQDTSNKYTVKDIMAGGKIPNYIHHHYKLSIEQARHLVRNYGFRSLAVCELGQEKHLLTPLAPGHPFLRAEVLYAVRHEMARTPSDILGRRLRLAFLDAPAAAVALDVVVEDMSRELNWSLEEVDRMATEGRKFLETVQGGMF